MDDEQKVDVEELIEQADEKINSGVHDWTFNMECSKCGRIYCDHENKY